MKEEIDIKRVLSCVLIVLLFFTIVPMSIRAAERDVETIYFEDGSYLVTEIITNGSRASGSVTGSKPSTYYNSSGTAQWKATLTGSFTYTGSSATCTSSSMNVTIYDSSWYTISKSASKSGNTAYGSTSIGEKVGGITVTKVPVSLSLTCDANGNLS